MESARFQIVDGSKRKAMPCAELRVSPDGEFSIDIADSAGVDDVPALFIPFIERGERTIGDKWARRWVQDRICPPGRQNLGEVLRAHGLAEYDELALLRAGEGKSSQDDFLVKEVPRRDGGGPDKRLQRRIALGNSIREARKARSLSQAELAYKVGIDQPYLSLIERGKANPTFDLLADLVEALDMDDFTGFFG